MQTKTRPHKIIDWVGLFVLLVCIGTAMSSCEESCYDGDLNNNEEAIDCGGPCVPCDTTAGTCFDGIQNQGEEGIDCGGPCNACVTDTIVTDPNFLCNGTGGSSYYPLTLNSYWIYSMPSNEWFQLEVTETITQNNGEEYAHMITTGAFGTVHDYYRASGGQILKWNTDLNIDELYIPENPTIGQQWSTTNADSIIVDDIAATLNSQNGCAYEGLLQITTYSGGSGATRFHKAGLGLVELSNVSAYIDSAVVY
jgi:hypothetical protein